MIIDFLSIKINISVDDTKKIIDDLLSIDQSKLEFINKSCGELLYYDIFKIIRSVNTDVVIQNSILHYIIVEIIKNIPNNKKTFVHNYYYYKFFISKYTNKIYKTEIYDVIKSHLINN